MLKPWHGGPPETRCIGCPLTNGVALIDFEKPIACIPSLAIHLDRTANEGRKINPQTEMSPIVLQLEEGEKRTLDDLLRYQLNIQNILDVQKVLSHELVFYDVQPPNLVGFDEQFISGARLDNLISCYVICEALCNSKDDETSLISPGDQTRESVPGSRRFDSQSRNTTEKRETRRKNAPPKTTIYNKKRTCLA